MSIRMWYQIPSPEKRAVLREMVSKVCMWGRFPTYHEKFVHFVWGEILLEVCIYIHSWLIDNDLIEHLRIWNLLSHGWKRDNIEVYGTVT
jgi:hypothetical protein